MAVDLQYIRKHRRWPSENDAVDHCESVLKPFCISFVREPPLSGGLRPDVGFRLKEFPAVPLLLECKNFSDGFDVSTFTSAVHQARSYLDSLPEPQRFKAFVGPIVGVGKNGLDFRFYSETSAVKALLSMAAHDNVGALVINPKPYWDNRDAILVLGNEPIASFYLQSRAGGRQVHYHPNAAHLLKYKSRKGSRAWRQ